MATQQLPATQLPANQLPPVPQQIGVFDQLVAKQTETLILREKVMSLSGDSFEIKLASGQPVLQVRGSVMSISGRKSVYDMANTHLFDIVKEHLHVHTTFAAKDPQGKKFLEVRNSFFTRTSSHSALVSLPPTSKPSPPPPGGRKHPI